MSRVLICSWALLVLLTSAAAAAPDLGFCPVMPASRAREKFFVEHEGARIYLCCASCIRKFKKKPEKYLARLREDG